MLVERVVSVQVVSMNVRFVEFEVVAKAPVAFHKSFLELVSDAVVVRLPRQLSSSSDPS